MKHFAFEDNGCPCADCERFYGNPYDPEYRARQRKRRAYERSWHLWRIRIDRERLIQEQE